MSTPSNALNITQSGLVTFDGAHTFSSVAPSTSGNLATANGTTWTSAAPVLKSVSVQINSAAIKTLVASPVVLVPNQGANTLIVPFDGFLEYVYAGTNQFTGGGALFLKFSGFKFGPPIFSSANIQGAANVYALPALNEIGPTSTTSYLNTALSFSSDGPSEFAGNAAGDNYINIFLVYYVVLMN